MTREDIECIIKWFSHIEQLATDGKTANGFQMPPDKILATIKVVAKDSREYVEKFCYESTPNDLEKAAEKSLRLAGFHNMETRGMDWKGGFTAGAEWQAEQFEKNRLASCDNMSKEEYDRETDFVESIIEKEHRQPTFSDAINYGMRLQKEQAEKDILAIIKSRISEILGDAQPKPALRAELEELIKRIKDDY